jgi:gamma-glutamylcyclotransferase (GGCT)/AIG2-like uncharacterized protein YtfP
MPMDVDCRLAVYGTLAPGRSNHHELAGLRGTWRAGTVRGHRVATGWGVALGYPALALDRDGDDVAVELFESANLPNHWTRLDAFEGSAYRRTWVEVMTADGAVDAWIYTAADPSAVMAAIEARARDG